jgi:hypothetical protein
MHQIRYYKDGYSDIKFCHVCGAEGLRLFDACDTTHISTDRCRMARYLGLSDNADTWPLRILDQLIALEKREGREKLEIEIRKLNGNG